MNFSRFRFRDTGIFFGLVLLGVKALRYLRREYRRQELQSRKGVEKNVSSQEGGSRGEKE